ncbi:MAG: sensor histidine kinase, partial [Chitinophagaceae bacterium]
LATKAAGIGIWDWQIVENKMYYSPQVKTMLGYAPNELEDSISTFSLLLHPNHNQEIIQKLNDHIYNKKDTYEAIVQLRTKENDYKWILISSKAISRDEQGRALRLTGIHLDVDKLKKKEIQLSELTDELMHSNNELRQFAYITSHNLRAPVANMLSLLALFEKEQLADMNAVLFEKLDWSIKKLDDTLKDLNEILSSRVSKAVTVTNIDFKELIDNCCKSLSEDIKSANANINIQLAVTNIPYSQKVLQSVMQNLMTNAIKYRRKDVPLSITISTEWQDKNVLLSFRDNGIGIDLKKYGNKIFGLYQRFNTDIEGKGMGLFIVKNQIEALHGSIKISSEPLKGTCFQLLLVPLTQKG